MEGQGVKGSGVSKLCRVSVEVEVEVAHDQDAELVAEYAAIGARKELRAQGCDVLGVGGGVDWESAPAS